MFYRFRSALAILVLSSGLATAQAPPAVVEVLTPPETTLPAVDGPAPRGSRVWLSGDFLLWWIKEAPVPVPLVTTGPFDPNLLAQPVPAVGALGNPTTQVLFGGKSVDLGTFSGMRFQAGLALDAEQVFALEGGAFFLEPPDQHLRG